MGWYFPPPDATGIHDNYALVALSIFCDLDKLMFLKNGTFELDEYHMDIVNWCLKYRGDPLQLSMEEYVAFGKENGLI